LIDTGAQERSPALRIKPVDLGAKSQPVDLGARSRLVDPAAKARVKKTKKLDYNLSLVDMFRPPEERKKKS